MLIKRVALLVTVTLLGAWTAAAQQTYEVTIDKPERYGNAAKGSSVSTFRLWVPEGKTPEYILLFLSYNGRDDSIGDAEDIPNREFARQHNVALLTCRCERKDGGAGFDQIDQWAGKLILDAVKKLAAAAGRPDLAQAPLLVMGYGSPQVVSGLLGWKNDRVVAATSNTGIKFGAHGNENGPDNAYKTPFLIYENETPTNLGVWNDMFEKFNTARKRGALWCVAPKYTGNQDCTVLSREFFASVIAWRKAGAGDGWLGNWQDKGIAPKGGRPANARDTVWLPDENFARAWQRFVNEKNEKK
ncbi:MAG: hypothetical protein LBD30_01240 [Verrucomicrobiales bacterium]|nr:hypothetical protein [Verrucomicrobiales bacterium]